MAFGDKMGRVLRDQIGNATGVRILLAIGKEQGIAPAEGLAGSGLTQSRLAEPDAVVRARQEVQVARNLIIRLGPAFPLGLEAGMRSHPVTLGIWGFALLASATVREALQVGLRHLDLTSVFCRIVQQEAAGRLALIGEDDDLPPDVRAFLVERDGTMVYRLLRDMTGTLPDLPPIEFKCPAPPYAQRFIEVLGRAPLFDQERNCVSVPNSLLDSRLPQADPVTLQACESECRRLVEAYRAREGFSGRVRDALLRQPGQIPAMDALAADLGIGVRSLRRRLAEEGTTFDALRDELRMALASELLSRTTLSAEEIAERLGYAELSCFSRAFKRRHGVGPRGFRAHRSARPEYEK